MLRAYALLISAALHLTCCHPAHEELKIPQVNISNPLEINNLNIYKHQVDLGPEDQKHFKRTVSKLEKSANYLDKTVRQVETLLNTNSSLPRLTRGEILEIIENITASDVQVKLKEKERTQKAIMLVMPYTPDNADDGKMQELFTRPPVTRIIGDSHKVQVKPTNKKRRRPSPQMPEGGFLGEVFPEPLPERTTERKPSSSPGKDTEEAPSKKPLFFSQAPLATKPSTTEKATTPSYSPEPEIITYSPFLKDLATEREKQRRRRPQVSTETSVVTNTNAQTSTPTRKRRPSKSPARYPNHKYPDESQGASKQGLKVIEPPELATTANPSPVFNPIEITTKKQEFTLPSAAPARPSRPHRFTTAKPALPDLPEDLQSALDDLNLGDSLSKDSAKYSAQYDADTANLPTAPPLKDNVKDILASIGVLPSTTTTTGIPDISHVADTLTPDMRELLMSFGLLPDPNYKPQKSKGAFSAAVSTAEVKPDSYVQFKPLPDNGPTRDEMEEFLGRFGLGRSMKNASVQNPAAKKPEKALNEVPQVEEGMLPDSMKAVLTDLGIPERQGKKIQAEPFHRTVNSPEEKTTEKQHIFNPVDSSYATQDELEKLNQLMDIIKQLEKLNGTATEEDLNKIDLKNLKDLVGSFDKEEFVPLDEQEWAPDPLNYDYSVSKNEVKRQENSSSTAQPAVVTVTAVVVTSPSSTTTEATNLKDLEDSFGGPSNTEPPATLPPPTEAPKTGFYYLLDWNTFLDIDDQKGKRVNLRFQPKAGDPQKFIAVTVP